MKYPVLFVFILVFLNSCGGGQALSKLPKLPVNPGPSVQADLLGATTQRETPSDAESNSDYKNADRLLANISRQLSEPNILREDIIRGWYLGGKDDRKFGTPSDWIFKEDGANSKWISPNVLDDSELTDDRQLCRETAGTYVASCLQTSDSDCEYVEKSTCRCLPGSNWAEGQGCILVNDQGSYVSVNNAELSQGWYLGLPNEKKLNTPSDWVWIERGKQSVWSKN